MAYNRGIYVNQNGNWVAVTLPSVSQIGNPNGQWQSIHNGWVNVNGQWKQFFPSNGTQTYTSAGTYTFTVPPGIHRVTIDAAGAGGGGAGGEEVGNGASGGGGGSGGFVQYQVLQVTPGEIITFTVGTGGAGAPFVGRTTAAPGGSNGGDTYASYGSNTFVLHGGSGAPPTDHTNDNGGGGGGGSIICTKLHELGYLSDRIYEADELFGAYLRKTDPNSYYGYLKWAGTVVDWIEGNGPNIMPWIKDENIRKQRQQELVTNWTVRIATPWAYHMAHLMGVEEQDNRAGKIIMNTGRFISRLIGKFSRTTKTNNNPVTGYILWATFSIFWLLAGIK